METMDQVLSAHRFFAGFPDEYAQLVAGCARNHRFNPGEYLFREGEEANSFYLIRRGKVSIEIGAPGHASVVISTLGEGELVGVSWLVAPYRSMFDARAVDLTRVIGIDCTCVRDKCDVDHDFGYEMMKRFLPVMAQRLHAARLQILDVYGGQ